MAADYVDEYEKDIANLRGKLLPEIESSLKANIRLLGRRDQLDCANRTISSNSLNLSIKAG